MAMNFTLVHNGKTNDESDTVGDAAEIAVTGWVYFVAQLPEGQPALAPAVGAKGTGYWVRTFKGYFDTDGVLKNAPGGTAGVRIWANDPLLNLEQLPYLVYAPDGLRANGKIIDFAPFVFNAPSADVEVKYSEIAPVPSATAVGVSRGYSPVWVKVSEGPPRLWQQYIVESNTFLGEPTDIMPDVTAEVSAAIADQVPDVVPGAVSEAITEQLSAAVTPAVDFDLSRRDIAFVDEGGGSGHFTVGGVAISGTVVPPAATWSGVGGKPGTLVDLDVHNWNPSNTRRVLKSIDKAREGTLGSDHLICSDSTAAGYVGVMDYTASWPWQMGDQLAGRGIPMGGTGWVFPCNDDGFALDPRWTRSGLWSLQTGYLWSVTPGDKLIFESDAIGETVKVAVLNDSVPFSVSVDGRPPTTVTPTQDTPGVSGVFVYTDTGYAKTRHRLEITATTAGNLRVFAAGIFSATGLQIHNAALIGQSANKWSLVTGKIGRGWVVNRLGLNPDVVHIALGPNDLDYSYTAAQTITAITAIRNTWPDADAILYAQAAPAPDAAVTTPPSDATWLDYVTKLYALADTLNCPLVDWYRMLGGTYANANANGYMADKIHPKRLGQTPLATTVVNLMTRKAVVG